MKTKSIMTLAAMALMMAACTSEDLTQPQTPSSKGIPFTATISGKAATRAIKENTTDGILETSWAKGEKVALMHGNIVDVMEVTEVGTDGSATISGTITGSPADGTEVDLFYPASVVDVSGESPEVKTNEKLLAEQDGKLETIAEKYDFRRKDGAKLKIVLGSASLDGAVSLENQLAIVRFSLSDGSDVLEAESFEIDDNSGQPIITVKPETADSVLYVAMPPATAQAFHFIAKKGNEEYFYSQPSATIAAGYYYQSSVELHHEIKYIEASWNSTDHKVEYNEQTLSDASQYTLVTSSTTAVTWSAGTYVVSSDVSIGGNITLTGDVNLILRDGAELTISGKIDGGKTNSLNIYGQKASTGKLTINGDGSIGSYNIYVKDLQIHGGDITGTNSGQALLSNGTLKIYHGTISTTARSPGIFADHGKLSIYGGTITASTTQSGAVAVQNADMEMTGGTLKATTTAQGEAGIVVHGGDIDISGGTVIAEGGTSTTADGGNGIHGMKDIKICGTANVTATGGDGAAVAGKHGGYGIYANNQAIEISGGTVKAIGGGGSDGHAIKTGGATGNVSIISGTVTATATGTNGNGIESNFINYWGGRAEATGAGSGWGINGTLTNQTSGSVTIKTKLTGGEADWTSSSIGPGFQRDPSQLHFRCIKINM